MCKQNIELYDFDGHKLAYKVSEVNWTSEQSEKNGYDYFMQKEIHEQPKVIRSILKHILKMMKLFFQT